MPKIGKKNHDIRVISRNLHDPEVKKEYDKFLKTLEDDSEHADWTRPGEEEEKQSPDLEVVS